MEGFWTHHGIFVGILFGLCLLFLPRATLFLGAVVFSAFPFGGFLWWVIGWLCFPRILIAIMAIAAYGPTNPFLCWFAVCLLTAVDLLEKGIAASR